MKYPNKNIHALLSEIAENMNSAAKLKIIHDLMHIPVDCGCENYPECECPKETTSLVTLEEALMLLNVDDRN